MHLKVTKLVLGEANPQMMAVKVCNEIEKSLIMKEVMVAVFLDIQKAYDTMWREGVLIKLGKLGINGKMYNYILDFLSQLSGLM